MGRRARFYLFENLSVLAILSFDLQSGSLSEFLLS